MLLWGSQLGFNGLRELAGALLGFGSRWSLQDTLVNNITLGLAYLESCVLMMCVLAHMRCMWLLGMRRVQMLSGVLLHCCLMMWVCDLLIFNVSLRVNGVIRDVFLLNLVIVNLDFRLLLDHCELLVKLLLDRLFNRRLFVDR